MPFHELGKGFLAFGQTHLPVTVHGLVGGEWDGFQPPLNPCSVHSLPHLPPPLSTGVSLDWYFMHGCPPSSPLVAVAGICCRPIHGGVVGRENPDYSPAPAIHADAQGSPALGHLGVGVQ